MDGFAHSSDVSYVTAAAGSSCTAGKLTMWQGVRMTKKKTSVQAISVIVPKNPFVPRDLQDVKLCLAA